jgi:hypothetical protein
MASGMFCVHFLHRDWVVRSKVMSTPQKEGCASDALGDAFGFGRTADWVNDRACVRSVGGISLEPDNKPNRPPVRLPAQMKETGALRLGPKAREVFIQAKRTCRSNKYRERSGHKIKLVGLSAGLGKRIDPL